MEPQFTQQRESLSYNFVHKILIVEQEEHVQVEEKLMRSNNIATAWVYVVCTRTHTQLELGYSGTEQLTEFNSQHTHIAQENKPP